MNQHSLHDLIQHGIKSHGHNGPFLILGIKLAYFAEQTLQEEITRCEVEIMETFPIQCTIHGLTTIINKDQIVITKGRGIYATFYSSTGKRISIRVNQSIIKKYLDACNSEYQLYLKRIIPLAQEVENITETQLFKII